ncbi:hypothetical protein C8Q76DRAFT_798523 [Earliella scabrosa]|nr:hypothetical protein C8Q76DRAFT_798523 [Earliella scabrosa]
MPSPPTAVECYELMQGNGGHRLPYPHAPSLQNTFGAFLICTCLGCMLFGLTAHQTYRYFRLYPSDRPTMKSFVIILLGLDIIHTITSIHVCYHYLVLNFFNPCALLEGVWILVSHCFYARRLFLLGGNTFVPVIIIGALLLVEIGFSAAATVETFIQEEFARFSPFMWLIWVVLLAAVLVDLVSTTILTFYLRKSRTGFKRRLANGVYNQYRTIYQARSVAGSTSPSADSFTLHSILSLTAFICSVVLRDTLIWAAITVVGTKMYANSLLAVVNSRRSIIDKGLEGFETGSFGLKVVNPRTRQSHAVGLPESPQHLQTPANQSVIDVKVMTETFVDIPAGATTPETARTAQHHRPSC